VIADPTYDPDTAPEVIAERFDLLRRQPLGNLLGELYTISGAPPDVQRDFNALNIARRELAHHIFVRPSFVAAVQTTEGRDSLIKRVKAWALEFHGAAEMVVKSALRRAERFGVDPRIIYEHARAVGAGEAELSSSAHALVDLEKTFTPEKLEQMAQRLGFRPRIARLRWPPGRDGRCAKVVSAWRVSPSPESLPRRSWR
jgi:hypothetical protein